jgi:ParB-like chromosome segregation protein Spo0J
LKNGKRAESPGHDGRNVADQAHLAVLDERARAPRSAVEKVGASLKEYGWRQPIAVDAARVIVVGHVRRLAAIQLEWTVAPVHVAADLTPAQVKVYRLRTIDPR